MSRQESTGRDKVHGEAVDTASMAGRRIRLRSPFGAEYAWCSPWGLLERFYIRTFGVVDLPSRIRTRLVIRKLRKFRWKALFDLACGTGTYSFYFSRLPSAQVWGMDINGSRIADCKAIADRIGRDNVRFFTGDGHLGLRKFDSGSVDVIIVIEALQYFPDTRLALLEFHRLLRVGGYLVGHVPVLGYLRPYETILFDDQNLPQLLSDAGFQILSLTPTFGGVIRRLCQVFTLISRSRILTALLFPLLLLTSAFCRVEATDGDYRFFVARKPSSSDRSLTYDCIDGS